MKISGLVLFKNEGRFFLRESVLSFLQLCDEIIAVDSGCTDGGESVAVLESLNDPRIKVLHRTQKSDKNKNYGEIKNWAMQFCKGDYVFSFDADECLDDKFYLVREQLEKNPDIDVWSIQGRHYYWTLNKEDAQVPEHWWTNRLFKNSVKHRYPDGRAHGLVEGIAGTTYGKLKGVFIHHYGYCKNTVIDLWRYNMNWEAPEIHSPEYLNDWIALRMKGTFPTKEVGLDVHPQVVKDKFHFERWNQ